MTLVWLVKFFVMLLGTRTRQARNSWVLLGCKPRVSVELERVDLLYALEQ